MVTDAAKPEGFAHCNNPASLDAIQMRRKRK
jgi:hypothetical protein